MPEFAIGQKDTNKKQLIPKKVKKLPKLVPSLYCTLK